MHRTRPAVPRRTLRVAGAVVLALGVVVMPGGGALGPAPAQAQAAPRTFTPSPAVGSDTSAITGVTDGVCDVPGTAAAPVDGFNAVVVGPGGFAPKPEAGRPDGIAIVSTTDEGFSTTAPSTFSFRTTFRGIAAELETELLPGDYVVTFRCVNQFDGVIYQKFSATFTFTGGPPATAYGVTDPPLGTPPVAVPGAGPGLPAPDAARADVAPAGEAEVATPVQVAATAALVGVVVGAAIFGIRRHRSSDRRPVRPTPSGTRPPVHGSSDV